MESITQKQTKNKDGAFHEKRIAIDTIKNPSKWLLGGPSSEESEKLLRTKYKYTDKMINKLQGGK